MLKTLVGKIADNIYSVYFCFRYLPFSWALKLPIKVSTNLKVSSLTRGQIELGTIKYSIVKLGIGGSPGMQHFNTNIHMARGAKVVFLGGAVIAEGSVLRCDANSNIIIGDNFYCNCNCYLRSSSEIYFGHDCTLGWNVTLNTNDGHEIWHNEIRNSMEGPIKIGNNVWLTPHSVVLKKVSLPSNVIVAQKAIVTKSFEIEHCLIGGIPAKIIATGIDWKA